MNESNESKTEAVSEPEGQEGPAGTSLSDERIAANRRNAKLATGPKTKAGKNRSRRNAVQHGILTSVLLIMEGDGAEDSAAFFGFFRDLRRDLRPVGTAEEALVQTIAICYWKERRALQYEAGSIEHTFMYDGLLRRRQWDEPADVAANRKLCFRLPLSDRLERILRYQTANRHQLDSALNHLERMQLARKSKEPAPVAGKLQGSKKPLSRR